MLSFVPMYRKVGAAFVALFILFAGGSALGHKSISREVIKSQGPAFCVEDERLVPVMHHGYNPERIGGWVYTCKPFESKGKFAR